MSASDLHFQPQPYAAARPATAPTAEATIPSKQHTPTKGRAYRVGMKWTRRVHLWSGLFLVPWVVLYGVTAYLFNHPTSTRRAIAAEELAASGLLDATSTSRAESWTASILGTINRGLPAAEQVQLAGTPEFSGRFSFRGQTPGHQVFARIDPASQAGSWSTRERRERQARALFLPSGKVHIRVADRERDENAGKELVRAAIQSGHAEHSRTRGPSEAAGPQLENWSMRSAPVLEIPVLDADRDRWTLRYDAVRDQLSAKRQVEGTEPTSMSWRSFALRLHKAHTYPDTFSARFVWALLVDLMAIAMVTWALSGVLMWWQIRSLRRTGIAIGIVSALVASWLAFGMHSDFLS